MARQEPDASMTGLGYVTGPEGTWRYTGEGWEWMPSPESVQLALQKVAASDMSPEEAYRFLASEGAVTGTRESMPAETAKALVAAGATPERAAAIGKAIYAGQMANEADYRGGDFFDVEGLTDVLKEDVIPFAATAAALYGGAAGLGGMTGGGAVGTAGTAGSAAAEGAGASLADIAAGGAATGSTGGGMDWLNSVPDDLGYDFVPGESLTNPFPGIPNDTGWDFGPDMGNVPITSNPPLAPDFWSTLKSYGPTAVNAVQRLLQGGGTQSDLLELLGRVAPALLGAFASNRQADKLGALAERFEGYGAPSRARFESSFAPGFTMATDPGYKDALDATTKSFLHKASIAGNPADSPNAWMATLEDVNKTFAYPALQDFRRLNANTGGLSRFAEAAPGAATSAINAERGIYDAIGAGAADVFNPPKSLADIMREARRAGY